MDTTIRTRHRLVKALVESRGYAPLAREIGTSAGYLHDLAHGRRNGSREILERIAEHCGVEVGDLIHTEQVA